jgi:soluble lytic murein transglycosylase-like protein
MGALIRIAFACAMLVASPAHADEVWRWRPYIVEASARFGIPTAWIERVMRAESAGRTTHNGKPVRSRAGAMGLMQLMPRTWAEMRTQHRLGPDPDDPRDNILAGAGYLRAMYDRFGYPGLFGAYNAGPKRYADHLAGEALPGETIAYLRSVAGSAPMPATMPRAAAVDRLFAMRRDPVSPPSAEPELPAVDSLFAIRTDAR